MKKMNVIPLIMSVFLLFSCNQEQVFSDITNEKTVSKESQEKEKTYLFAQEVFYAATLEKVEQLENRLVELSGKKENGEKDVINKIEKTQKQIEKYKNASDYFYAMRPPKGLRPGPIPRPCPTRANCTPKIIFLQQIVIGENNMEVKNLEVKNAEGEVVARGEMGEGKYGRTVNVEVKEFKGQATMHVEVSIENKTEISLDIPVLGN